MYTKQETEAGLRQVRHMAFSPEEQQVPPPSSAAIQSDVTVQ